MRAVMRAVRWVHIEPATRGRRRDGRYVYRSPAMVGTPCCTTSPSVGRTRARYEAHMRPALIHRGSHCCRWCCWWDWSDWWDWWVWCRCWGCCGCWFGWRGWRGGRQKRRRIPSTAVTSRIHSVAACNMGSSRRWRVGSPPPPTPPPLSPPSPLASPCSSVGGGIRYLPKRTKEDKKKCSNTCPTNSKQHKKNVVLAFDTRKRKRPHLTLKIDTTHVHSFIHSLRCTTKDNVTF